MDTPPKGRNGQVLVSTWVPAEVAERFRTWTRQRAGGASLALRELIVRAMEEGGETPSGSPTADPGPALGYRVGIRLRDAERLALLRAAEARHTTPANWLRSLALVHLANQPRWSNAELDALRDLSVELRRIGGEVNAMARSLYVAGPGGTIPPGTGQAVQAVAERITEQVRRVVVSAMEGNFDYWGLPEAERPRTKPPRQRPGRVPRAAKELPELEGPMPRVPAPRGPAMAVLSLEGEQHLSRVMAGIDERFAHYTPAQRAEIEIHTRQALLAKGYGAS